jgi:hypothetical protein
MFKAWQKDRKPKETRVIFSTPFYINNLKYRFAFFKKKSA